MSKPCAETRRAAAAALLAAALLGGCSTAAKDLPAQAPTAAAAPIPDDVRNAYSGALSAMQKSDWPAAQSLLENLASTHPDLPGPAVNLAIVYSHLDRADDARKTLENVVAHFPDFAPGQHQLGLLLAGQGKFEAADAAYAHALSADPHYALAYYDRAVLNDLYLQRPQVALQNYEQFQSLQAGPDKRVAGWIDDLRRRVAASPQSKDSSGGPHT